MTRICKKPGCGAVITRYSRYGTCKLHRHAEGICACPKCQRREVMLTKLRDCAAQGMTAPQAQAYVPVSVTHIYFLAKRHGIEFAPAVIPDTTATRPRLRRKVPPRPPRLRAVGREPRRARRDSLDAIWHPKWSPSEDLLLWRRRATGAWFCEIARDLGRGTVEVEQRFHRLRAVEDIAARLLDHVTGCADPTAPWPDPSEVAA